MSIIRKIVFALMAFSSLPTCAQGDSLSTDSSVGMEDSTTVVTHKKKKNIFRFIGDIVRSFSDYDEEYIEPQHYNYALMLQNTNTYEAKNVFFLFIFNNSGTILPNNRRISAQGITLSTNWQ